MTIAYEAAELAIARQIGSHSAGELEDYAGEGVSADSMLGKPEDHTGDGIASVDCATVGCWTLP